MISYSRLFDDFIQYIMEKNVHPKHQVRCNVDLKESFDDLGETLTLSCWKLDEKIDMCVR